MLAAALVRRKAEPCDKQRSFMPTNSKQSNAGCSSETNIGCGCLVFVVFGLLALSIPDLSELYAFVAFAGLILLLVGVGKSIAKKRHEQEYTKLLAEFKQDGMNEAAYERIVQFLSRVKQGTFKLDVAKTPPEELNRWKEVISFRYYAILDRLKTTNSPKLREELLTVGRGLRDLFSDPFSEWNEQRFANDLAILPTANQTGNSGNVATQIEQLGNLHKQGVITQEEFNRGKALFLGNPPDIAAQTLNILDGLHKLKANGALSESEYNVKKWELLSGKNLNPK